MAETEREPRYATDDWETAGRVTAWRNHVVALVEERDGSVSIAAVTDRIVDRESAATDGLLTWSEVHSELYRRTLPELTEEGVVAFDANRGIVEPIEDGYDAEPSCDGGTTQTRKRRKTRYALGVYVVGAVLSGLTSLQVRPFVGLSIPWLLAGCIALFAVLAVAQARGA